MLVNICYRLGIKNYCAESKNTPFTVRTENPAAAHPLEQDIAFIKTIDIYQIMTYN